MKVAEVIASKEPLWQELEKLCEHGGLTMNAASVERFAFLYRSACADLALAESYRLPKQNVDYLHRLVAVAHNKLYRSSRYQWQSWYRVIFQDTPQMIFREPCVHFCFCLFWGLFIGAAILAYHDRVWPGFAEDVLGTEFLEMLEKMYREPTSGTAGTGSAMVGFYIFNNAGMLLLVPGIVTLTHNAVVLGAVFGHMFRPDMGEAGIHFKTFVTAHGPLELTAIVLAAGAGLKIGLSWLITGGLRRADSLKETARRSLPIVMSAVVLFCLAAFVEGFISPAPAELMPWWIKGIVSVFTSMMLMFYFVVLGFPYKL
jgi:uncharacterized membrane protein SpoIIM required for sporulation